ncbi:molybdopterin-dependent oxidoreductase [Paenibacillus sp. CGMCC 1.16610]|uniref:Molybdopterin-dependent oxidoreductase n=1 Tax=Paenibacillus anseongense TaxID=2682845 RepID=A0ABW9UDB9_9BACL|nr:MULTISPECIES: molybdopterin-dependent oxidoreductase [Paenibacillus]MBA2940659.1 molybdopterin-dependent oxidoreductase [Paenibacillus sp. CGMCC 1.16610]MVQ35835.1 molybdopterin-dependent oxidoreductase [Paenibacillus anseongense]
MESKRGWLKQSFGKRLNAIHSWNAWILLLLTITGIVLSIGAIRGDLGIVRVSLKQLHIYLGVASILLMILYAPMIRKHWRQIRTRRNQRANLVFVLALLVGWAASGVVLWQFRHLPPALNNAALLIHDLLTWVGVPYAVYHAISRSRWLKRQQRLDQAAAAVKPPAAQPAAVPPVAASDATAERSAAQAVIAALKASPITRASFLRLAAGLVLVIAVGPAFYRWIKGAFDTGGSSTAEYVAGDGNSMLPPPAPLPDSAAVVGGGAQGNFRIYTVTEIPAFSSENWQFAISGLVDKPAVWNWEEFLKLKRTVQVSNFHCVTGWSIYNCTWEGIPLKQFLAAAGVQSKAKFVKFYSGDKVYTDALSLEQAEGDDIMVAVMLDGKPIPQKLGGPVRLIVPQMYAYKSVKWLQAIELIEKEHMGYWEVRGYDNDAWVDRSNNA